MARGDIFRVHFPVPAGSGGREQIGSRPAIVVQTDTTDLRLPTTVVVPMTAQLAAARFPHTIQVVPSPQNGLVKPSVLLVFQLRAIDKGRLVSKLGTLEAQHMTALEAEIRALLGL
jgi:mRNA interferase MazF